MTGCGFSCGRRARRRKEIQSDDYCQVRWKISLDRNYRGLGHRSPCRPRRGPGGYGHDGEEGHHPRHHQEGLCPFSLRRPCPILYRPRPGMRPHLSIKDADKKYVNPALRDLPVIGSLFGQGQTAMSRSFLRPNRLDCDVVGSKNGYGHQGRRYAQETEYSLCLRSRGKPA
jgi:hypothetical protein